MKYIRPTSVTEISDSFADHVARGSLNPGTDYVTAKGVPVVAPAGGRIAHIDPFNDGSGGRMIALDTYDGDGFDFLHLSRIDVNINEYVSQGEVIGLTGASANGSENGVGPHLHLSYRQQHGHHYMNAGNLDFEQFLLAPAGGTGTPIPPTSIVTPERNEEETMRLIKDGKVTYVAVPGRTLIQVKEKGIPDVGTAEQRTQAAEAALSKVLSAPAGTVTDLKNIYDVQAVERYFAQAKPSVDGPR